MSPGVGARPGTSRGRTAVTRVALTCLVALVAAMWLPGCGGSSPDDGTVIAFQPTRALPGPSARALDSVSGSVMQMPEGLSEHDLMDTMATPWKGFPDAATRAAFQRQLTAARGAAERYASAAAAAADGYVLASYFISGFGVHWINWARVTAPFDPAKPGMLLYDGDGSKAHLIGLSYYVRSPGNVPPDGFAGDNDRWHRHFGTCYSGSFLIGEDVPDAGTCSLRCQARATDAITAPVGTEAENGEMDRYVQTHPVPAEPPSYCNFVPADDLWMLHLWLVPGHTNPAGEFSTYNPDVHTCVDPCRPASRAASG